MIEAICPPRQLVIEAAVERIASRLATAVARDLISMNHINRTPTEVVDAIASRVAEYGRAVGEKVACEVILTEPK